MTDPPAGCWASTLNAQTSSTTPIKMKHLAPHMWCNCAPKERPMYMKRILACVVLVCFSLPMQSQTPAPPRRIVIAASTILDGKGQILKDTRIVVEGSKIVAIDPKVSPVDYDLRAL